MAKVGSQFFQILNSSSRNSHKLLKSGHTVTNPHDTEKKGFVAPNLDAEN